jgi:hypothetical protein
MKRSQKRFWISRSLDEISNFDHENPSLRVVLTDILQLVIDIKLRTLPAEAEFIAGQRSRNTTMYQFLSQ